MSLPVWEEWIEILPLKHYPRMRQSLPVWEEWIEIPPSTILLDIITSLPVWEEWIEISGINKNIALFSLFPYGKSGLKSDI